MKRISLIAVVVSLAFAFSSTALAKKKRMKKKKMKPKMTNTWDRPYGLAGCGLGSIVMGKEGNQVIAATTNNIYGLETQLFGISFGTSNCVESDTHKMAKKVDVFVHTNKVALASDMARGSGESVTTLGSLLGCSDSARFNRTMKSNFHHIYKTENTKTFDITDSVINVILKDEKLSKSCTNLNIG